MDSALAARAARVALRGDQRGRLGRPARGSLHHPPGLSRDVRPRAASPPRRRPAPRPLSYPVGAGAARGRGPRPPPPPGAGAASGVRPASSAAGVLFLTLEDESNNINVVIWQRILEQYRAAVVQGKLLKIKGVMERQNSVIHVIAGHVEDCSSYLAEFSLKSRDFR